MIRVHTGQNSPDRQDEVLQDEVLTVHSIRSRLSSARRRLAPLLAATFTLAVTAQLTHAETVPLPKPAPKGRLMAAAEPPRSLAPPPAAAKPAGNSADNAAAQAMPTPVIPDPRKRQPTNIFATFDANQRALIARVGQYLSSVQTMVGNFVQVGPDGTRTTGDFYMQKPGKIRFEYDAPSPIAIVADGTSVVVRDRRLATQDVYPLSQTPLRFLLSNNIDLMRDTSVISASADDLYVSVTIEEKHALAGTSRLMLMLGAKDNQLKQWTITDAQGYDTTVAVYNVDNTKKLSPGIFNIDYTNYSTPQQ